MNTNSIGYKLNYLRLSNRFSLDEVARNTGFLPTQLDDWERGRAIPTPECVMRLAHFYHVNLDFFSPRNPAPPLSTIAKTGPRTGGRTAPMPVAYPVPPPVGYGVPQISFPGTESLAPEYAHVRHRRTSTVPVRILIVLQMLVCIFGFVALAFGFVTADVAGVTTNYNGFRLLVDAPSNELGITFLRLGGWIVLAIFALFFALFFVRIFARVPRKSPVNPFVKIINLVFLLGLVLTAVGAILLLSSVEIGVYLYLGATLGTVLLLLIAYRGTGLFRIFGD